MFLSDDTLVCRDDRMEICRNIGVCKIGGKWIGVLYVRLDFGSGVFLYSWDRTISRNPNMVKICRCFVIKYGN